MNWKSYCIGMMTMYLYVAIAFGISLGDMRSLNLLGKIYVGATWPAAMFCVSSGLNCDVLPPEFISKYFFTFKEST